MSIGNAILGMLGLAPEFEKAETIISATQTGVEALSALTALLNGEDGEKFKKHMIELMGGSKEVDGKVHIDAKPVVAAANTNPASKTTTRAAANTSGNNDINSLLEDEDEVTPRAANPARPAVSAPKPITPAANGGDSGYAAQLASTGSEAEAKDMIGKLQKDRKSTRLNSSHIPLSRMPSSA